jgi:hypothetical protein
MNYEKEFKDYLEVLKTAKFEDCYPPANYDDWPQDYKIIATLEFRIRAIIAYRKARIRFRFSVGITFPLAFFAMLSLNPILTVIPIVMLLGAGVFDYFVISRTIDSLL